MLAMDARAPLGIRRPELSFTTIASKLAPTGGAWEGRGSGFQFSFFCVASENGRGLHRALSQGLLTRLNHSVNSRTFDNPCLSFATSSQ